jgi:hypothetical protein
MRFNASTTLNIGLWKTRLITEKNPDWHGLFDEIARASPS